MSEQLRTILIIIVSVSIFGLLVFVFVKNYIKNKLNYYLNVKNNINYKLTCHCNKIEIDVKLVDGLNNLYRCNCSICKRKGAITAVIPKNNLKILKGENQLKFYQFNTNVAKHFFCNTCGINTHNQRRSDPNTFGINVGCLDGISPKDLFELNVRINDGQNHIKDRKL